MKIGRSVHCGLGGVAVCIAAAALGLWGSALQSAPSEGQVLIRDVPHIRQRPDFCGEACVAMFLNKLGHRVTQEQVFDASGVDPALGRGCVTREMAAVLERLGFRPGSVWHRIDPTDATSRLAALWGELLTDLRAGVPSIVCMHYDDGARSSEHFRLVLGYNQSADEVIYHEPAEDNGAYRRMKRSRFVDLWPLKYRRDEWLVIRMRLAAGSLKLPKPPTGFTAADVAQHVMALRPRVPKGFTLVVQPPFVVIGDEQAKVVRARAERTVKWFVDRIRKLYFAKDPPAIYDIWLFRDETSYRKHTRMLFNETPDTPFGYCSDTQDALVMNIATGGGTLCHEIVHAFVASNFPACPSWFNEGLASLYEQCSGQGDRVMGLTNWRLAGLQKEIRAGTLPSFKTLISTTTTQFYTMRRGDNYAQARYLCYYLQQHGLLVKYYRAFRAHAKTDPSGYETLKQVLGETDLPAFQKRWETWVLGLRFP